jgi:hypothetical protein
MDGVVKSEDGTPERAYPVFGFTRFLRNNHRPAVGYGKLLSRRLARI